MLQALPLTLLRALTLTLTLTLLQAGVAYKDEEKANKDGDAVPPTPRGNATNAAPGTPRGVLSVRGSSPGGDEGVVVMMACEPLSVTVARVQPTPQGTGRPGMEGWAWGDGHGGPWDSILGGLTGTLCRWDGDRHAGGWGHARLHQEHAQGPALTLLLPHGAYAGRPWYHVRGAHVAIELSNMTPIVPQCMGREG